jgi:hypothetical protein
MPFNDYVYNKITHGYPHYKTADIGELRTDSHDSVLARTLL